VKRTPCSAAILTGKGKRGLNATAVAVTGLTHLVKTKKRKRHQWTGLSTRRLGVAASLQKGMKR